MVSHLGRHLELFHHPELEEAADAALDQLKLRQGEVAEVELVQLHLFGVGDVGFLWFISRRKGKKANIRAPFFHNESVDRMSCERLPTSSLYISFWSQSSGAEPSFSSVFCGGKRGHAVVVAPSAWCEVCFGSCRSTWAKAHQDGLNVAERGLCLVHEHFLGHLFAPLCPVQLVIGVAVQGGPAEELGQRLHTHET